MRKGQMTVEFLLLLLVMLLYAQTIIQPNVVISSAAANDVARVGRSVAELDKFYNAVIDVENSSGDAKRTVTLFIPANATFTYAGSSAIIKVTLSSDLTGYPITACGSGVCLKEKTFNGITGSGIITGPASKELAIEKIGSTVTVT